MSKNQKIWIGIIVAVVTVALFVWQVEWNSQNSGMIKIGFIGPLTGDLASMGEEQKFAMDLAVGEINGAGGINSQLIQMIYEDGQCDGAKAASAAQKLISVDNVKILMPVCSAEALAVVPIAGQNKVLEFAVWPTDPTYSGIGQYSFRDSYSDEDTGKVMAATIGARFSNIAVLTENVNYPVGLLNAFKKYFKGTIYEESYPPGSRDLRAQITKIIAQSPQAVVLNPNSPATGLAAVEQLRGLGYRGQIYGNFFGSGSDVLQSQAAQGMIFFSDPLVSQNALAAHLLDAYQKEFGKSPDFEFAVAAQYDSAYILKRAIATVGLDPTKLKDYLHALKDFSGVLGTYGFNDEGDVVGYSPSVKQIENGQAVLIPQ